jgi:peptidoglycan/LPS O-acetylase OafA/YrhL
MDLVRPILLGLGCCALASLLSLFLLPLVGSSLADPLLYLVFSLPILVGALLGGGLAARSHKEPQRRDRRRHLLAALAGPGVFALINAAGVAPELDAEWLVRTLNLVLPLAAGSLGMRLLDERPPAL